MQNYWEVIPSLGPLASCCFDHSLNPVLKANQSIYIVNIVDWGSSMT